MRSDHHGHDWQGPADAPPREEVGARDRAARRACRATRCASTCAPRRSEPPKYRRKAVTTKLAPFVETVKHGAVGRRAPPPQGAAHRQGATAADQAEAGYEGGYTQLTDFIRAWRRSKAGVAVGKAFVPLTFELGEAFQFDWSEEALVIGGIYRKLQVAHMKLCASRAFWLVAYPSQGHEMLFDAHTRSLRRAGRRGAPRHLRQHEDRRGQGAQGQGPHRQRTLRGDVRALPVRRRLLQRGLGLGEGGRREERAGQPPAHLDRRARAALRQLRPSSMPGWANVAGRCGRRSSIPSTSSSASPRCSSTSGRT